MRDHLSKGLMTKVPDVQIELEFRNVAPHIWPVNGRALRTTCDVINLNATGHLDRQMVELG